MNKMKKLLSVLLAVVIALSCMSVMASAAKTNYQTVADLANDGDGTGLDAYSPYGQVTRLSTEERASIVLDFLDSVLPGLNINMGTVLDVLGLTITINFTSVDNLCVSIDSFKDTFSNTLFSIAKGIVNLGVLEKLTFSSWDTGMTRDGVAQLKIFEELFALLDSNGSGDDNVIKNVLSSGLDLGIVGGLIGGLDLSSINNIVKDLPSLVKGLIFGLFERWDDTTAEITTLEAAKVGNGNVESTVNNFVKNLFTNDMSITTVKLNSAGTITSKHSLPTTGTRVIYSQSGNVLTAKSYATQKYVDAQAKLGNTVAVGDYYVSAVYVLEQEQGTTDYVWAQVEIDPETNEIVYEKDEDGNATTTPKHVGANLKYYEQGSQLLPSLTATIDLSSASLADLLYTFIPPVFNDLAPVVLNGSMKKILGGLFGAKYNYVGEVGDDAVNALPDASDAFFTEEQGDYVFEWSNYAVINGNHYYRFEDQIFAADLSNVNNYFYVIDWGYEITEGFMNEFIPTTPSKDSTLLMNLNNFLIKVAETITVASAETVNSTVEKDGTQFTATWERPAFTKGDNSNLVENIKKAAQAFIKLAPQHIFGSDYATNPRCYYNLMISDDNDTILTGIAAQLVDIIMPSMTLPSADQIVASKAKVGAILAAVIREFAAYLAPEYNYDNLIYADFGTTTADPEKTFVDPEAAGLVTEGQTASGYWLDVCLTIGLDVGYEYIRAFADIGEDSSEVLAGVVDQGYKHAGGTYAAGTTQAQLNAQWEAMLDYIIDWALEADYEWTWKMEKIVDTTGLTINLATVEDPWKKLDTILFNILPIDEVLNITATDCETRLEQALRYNLILAIVDLRWEDLADMLKVPDGFVRNTNVLDSLATVLKGLLNGLITKIGTYPGDTAYELIPSAITDFDSLANQSNLSTMVQNLVAHLYDAYQNGLLDVVLPFLNFFLGWKTDPQKLADPQIWTTFRDGNDYAFQWTGNGVYPTMDADNTIIHFQNNSSGMLETHKNSDVVDHEYQIQIKSVTSDATVNTLTFDYGDGLASPYETIDIKIGGTYNGEEAATITIAYDYIGKDGNAVGGTQYTSLTVLFSNQYEDANISGRFDGDNDKDYSGTDDFGRYQFTKDIYDTVVNYQARIFYVGSTFSNPDKSLGTIAAPDYDVTEVDCEDVYTYYDLSDDAKKYFAYRAADADAGWASTLSKDGTSETYGYLYKAASGVTADTEIPYGPYYMGRIAVAYGSDNKQYEIDFIYYNDYDIYDIYTANKDRGITANSVDAADIAIYNEWNAAFKDIVKYATYPMMTKQNGNSATDYVDTIQPHIPAAIERFEAADEALNNAMADANAAAGADATRPSYIDDLDTLMKTDDNDGEKEVNFQDYEFYEYFNYADLRTIGRNMVKEYVAPEVMDTYYIMGSGIREAELNNVIAAEDNAIIAAAIEATKMENDAQAIADSIAARENWVMPTYGKLNVQDLTARIAYYKQFLIKEAEVDNDLDSSTTTTATAHMYFLNQEIAHIEAQGLVEADYEAKSWANFAEKLATAKAVAAGTDEYSSFNSRIYDVKYNLMVAYKQLLKKADSLIEAGGTADLMANRDIADAIFASLAAGDGVWAVKEGVDANTAYAELITALGYYYVGEDGNTWNLYADSALEYIDNDRPNRSSNQAKVNAANNNLVAAIQNFEQAVAEKPELGVVDGTTGAFGETTIDEVTGIVSGYIYGVTAGEVAENYFALKDPSAGTVEWTAEEGKSVNGTGAVATVKNTAGDPVAVYTLVIFGDVNGDASITAADYGAVQRASLGATLEEGAVTMAADVVVDGSVTAADYGAVQRASLGATITVNPY